MSDLVYISPSVTVDEVKEYLPADYCVIGESDLLLTGAERARYMGKAIADIRKALANNLDVMTRVNSSKLFYTHGVIRRSIVECKKNPALFRHYMVSRLVCLQQVGATVLIIP